MIAGISCRRAQAFATFCMCLVMCGCGSSESLESSVPIKRGARIRIINLVGPTGEAKANERQIPIFSADKGTGWYSFVPPKETNITFGSLVSGAKSVQLRAERDYTVVMGASGSVSVFETEPAKPSVGGATLQIFNSTDRDLTVSVPNNFGNVSAGGVSKRSAFDGKAVAGGASVTATEVNAEGHYSAFFFSQKGKLAAKLVWDNPPMEVMGATQGR